ncbi:MAG: lysophospholipid acyltransferase family protein, partial [Candidatus Omnitrophica bacterium]|nr:lysophospholipid acyltransferase family protein [Candidatus Omnitrophota bacterium]
MAGDRILVILVKIIGLFFRTIPFSWGMKIASVIGTVLFWVDAKRKYIGFANMTQALGDSLDVEKRFYYLKRLYQNLAISFIEVLRFPELTAAEVAERINFQGTEQMNPFIGPEREKTFIVLTAHYGNWELMNQAFALCGIALNVMVRNQKMTGLNELLNEYRQWHGSRIISKGMSVREVFSCLGKKEPVGMLIDQDGGKKGIFSPLFGRLASTKSGAFVISMKTRTPLIPLFIIRDPNKKDRHLIYIEKPFSIPATEAEIAPMVHQYSKILERYVRKAPDQWLWLHHRWKSSPMQKIVVLEDGKKGHTKQSLAVAGLIVEARKQPEKIEIQTLSIRFKTRFKRTAASVLLTTPSNSLVWR